MLGFAVGALETLVSLATAPYDRMVERAQLVARKAHEKGVAPPSAEVLQSGLTALFPADASKLTSSGWSNVHREMMDAFLRC